MTDAKGKAKLAKLQEAVNAQKQALADAVAAMKSVQAQLEKVSFAAMAVLQT